VNNNGEAPRRLFTANGFVESIRWSPDGQRLSFSVRNTETGWLSLWETGNDGRNPHPLFPEPQGGIGRWNEGECCGDWTPDGKYFAYRSVHDGVESYWIVRERWSFRKSEGTAMQIYTSPDGLSKPRFSPDGKRILFVDSQQRRELLRYDSTRKLFVPYLSGIPARHLSFSRDWQWVAYKNEADGSLWRSRPDGTDAVQLTFPPLEVLHSTWSPDGKTVAFEADGTLMTIPSGGGKPELLLPQGEPGIQPNWSPDGKFLLFSRFNTSGSGDWSPAIYLLDLGTRRLQMVPGSEGCETPQWSPDGRYVAASSRKEQALVLLDFARNQWIKLADGMPYGWGIRWSADGSYVYYQHIYGGEEQPIFRVRVRDRQVEQITSRVKSCAPTSSVTR
jgi:Tol biopolymer transport system component